MHSMQSRILSLERQISLHQGLLSPFLDDSAKASPKSDSTMESASFPSSKRFCKGSDGNELGIFELSHNLVTLDTHLQIPHTLSSSNIPASIIPTYSSDHKRRFGIKSLLEQLESKVPKRNLDGTKLSNASLLLSAGDFASDLKHQVICFCYYVFLFLSNVLILIKYFFDNSF